MKTLYVPVGIPASGKTTYGNLMAKNNPNLRIVSPDEIRKELYGDPNIQGDGKKVFAIAYNAAATLLDLGHDVYFDATNISALRRSRLLKALSGHYCNAVGIAFTLDYTTCLERNRVRDRVVPTGVMIRMLRNHEAPSLTEGFSRVEVVFGD